MELRLTFVSLLVISGSCYGCPLVKSDEPYEPEPDYFIKVESRGDSDNWVVIALAGPGLFFKNDVKIHINKDFLTWLEIPAWKFMLLNINIFQLSRPCKSWILSSDCQVITYQLFMHALPACNCGLGYVEISV